MNNLNPLYLTETLNTSNGAVSHKLARRSSDPNLRQTASLMKLSGKEGGRYKASGNTNEEKGHVYNGLASKHFYNGNDVSGNIFKNKSLRSFAKADKQ